MDLGVRSIRMEFMEPYKDHEKPWGVGNFYFCGACEWFQVHVKIQRNVLANIIDMTTFRGGNGLKRFHNHEPRSTLAALNNSPATMISTG